MINGLVSAIQRWRWPLLGVGAAVMVVATILTPLRTSGWQATAAGTIEPTSQENSPLGAYRQEVATRGYLLDSFATALDRGGFADDVVPEIENGTVAVGVEASASPTTSVVSVTATSPSASVAEDVAQATMVQGAAFIAKLDGPFRLSLLEPTPATPSNGWIVENVARLGLAWLTLLIISLQVLRTDWPRIRDHLASRRSSGRGFVDGAEERGHVVSE